MKKNFINFLSFRKSLLLIAYFSIFMISCKKNDLTQKNSSQKEELQIAQQVPPEILESLYNDYLKANEIDKAKGLKASYNFVTGKRVAVKPIALNLYVPGVGNTLDGGYYTEVYGNSKAHIEKLGWVTYNFNSMNAYPAPHAYDNTAPPAGTYMGTVNQSKRMEAFMLPVVQYNLNGSISDNIIFTYRAYMQANGWLSWVQSGQIAGITGQSLRLEAFQITVSPQYVTLTNSLAIYQTKVFYRAQVESIGWQAWQSSGQTAGTTGQSKRCEAMQVRAYLIQ